MCACTCKCVCLSVSLRERWRVHVCERESGELTLRSLGTFPHIGIFNSHVLNCWVGGVAAGRLYGCMKVVKPTQMTTFTNPIPEDTWSRCVVNSNSLEGRRLLSRCTPRFQTRTRAGMRLNINSNSQSSM